MIRSVRHRLETTGLIPYALGAALVLTPAAPLWAQGAKALIPVAMAPKDAVSKAAKPAKSLTEEQKRNKAREAYSAAEQKAQANDYTGALDGYRAANELIASPQSLYKIAFCLDKLGKTSEALEGYQKFLAAPPPEKMDEQKKLTEARVAELGTGSIHVTSLPDGAAVKVDGAQGTDSTPATLKAKPGKHTVEVSAPNYEAASRDIDVSAGVTSELRVELKPSEPPAAAALPPAMPTPPAAEPIAPPPAAPPSKAPAYITLGLAAAGAAVGTVFGVQALSAKNDFKNQHTSDNADKAERDALISDMAFGVAATLGVTGIVLLLSNDSKPSGAQSAEVKRAKPTALRIAPVLSPKTQGVAAGFSF